MTDRSRRSTLRERQADVARLVIVDAARRLFAKRGYARTSMEDIAREAGVSIQTVYSNVGGKPLLVMALVDRADQITNVAELGRLVGTATDAHEVLRRAAALRRTFMEKAVDIVRVLSSAADGDDDVARAWREGQLRSRRVVECIVEKLSGYRALRTGLGEREAADVLFALYTPALYIRLTEECGWSPDQYETWLCDAMNRLVLDEIGAKRSRRRSSP